MKLLRAAFQNFRLLRDLELEFAYDPHMKLTVIRAANESGKTTILHGLQWALYGDAALPGKGDGFRLHPIDWDESDGMRVTITAMVEYELTTYRRVHGETRETRRRYRLVRSASEEVGSLRRIPSTMKLFLLSDTGAMQIEAPEAQIYDELPLELREVFFTDGDRALSFIQADVALSTKRERVNRAIRSLLGLGIIEDAIKHVRKSVTEVNKKAKQVSTNSELSRTASRLVTLESDREKLEADLEDATQQFGAFDEKVHEIDHRIEEALRLGDKEKLRRNLVSVRDEIRVLDGQLEEAVKEHSGLFRNRSIAADLLEPVLGGAFGKLEELRTQGKIPNTTIPVLQERLSSNICICGETLEPSSPDGTKRRAHIQKLIDDSRRADEIQEIITDLYYSSKPLLRSDVIESSSWRDDYKKVLERRESIDDLRGQAGQKYRALEKQLDALPDTDIQGLRHTRRQYVEQRDSNLSRKSMTETELMALNREYKKEESERDRLLREQKKGARILAEVDVTKDVSEILQKAYEQIMVQELQKVSELMNSIFLEMIGADPELGSIIQRAEISREFDIIVYGPHNRTLNPDRDLNGASRRALTLAFILSLTKVSEVEAPNVIDTPLGMTSGFVKRSILRTAVRESSQLILLLTHDEILGCEQIIDEAASVVFTLTNPAHYPIMLVNDPETEQRKVLRCGCDHKSVCNICEVHVDANVGREPAP